MHIHAAGDDGNARIGALSAVQSNRTSLVNMRMVSARNRHWKDDRNYRLAAVEHQHHQPLVPVTDAGASTVNAACPRPY